MKNKITIVVPLYGREDKTKIFLDNNINKNADYFFCDGGKTKSNEVLIKKILKENFYYKKFKTDRKLPYDYIKKILVSIKSVNSKYIMLADNDDFLNFKAIFKCIDILENNKGYQLASGDILHIRTSKINHKYHITPGIRSSRIYDDKKGKQNILNYFSLNLHNHILYYSIFRRNFLIKIFSELMIIKNFSMNHFEYFFNSLVIFYGKYKYVNCIHYIRLQNSIQSLNIKLNKKKNDNLLVKSSLNKLINISAKKFNFDKKEFEQILSNYFNIHKKKRLEKKVLNFMKLKNYFFSIFYRYPFSISSIIKKINLLKEINFYL